MSVESLETFDRLLSEQTSYLNEVDEQIAKWTQFQTDYQHLRTRLSTLPDRLTYDCTVPFGKLAFLPGRIIHSNEILVLLGENYFVERSCKQAREIVERRLENINERLDKHRKEKQLFSQQRQYANDFRSDQTDFIEIKEDEQDVESKPTNRRTKLTDDEIREERRRLQERAMKFNETKTKRVHFEKMETDSDDDDEIPHERMKKIFIHHTETDSKPIGDPSPALFAHPGAISKIQPKAFTGKMIERDVPTSSVEPLPLPPAKRVSKFKASRQ